MKKVIRTLILGTALLTAATAAHALTFDFNKVISGATPDGTPPWLTATFTDHSQLVDGIMKDGVTLDLKATGLTSTSDFVTVWDFNTKLGSLSGLKYLQSSTGAALTGLTNTGNDTISAGTGSRYDIEFQFATKNKDKDARFMGGDLDSLFLYNVTGLTAETFNTVSVPAEKAYFAEAHIQGIGTNDGSTWVVPGNNPVPEPGTMMLLGAGFLGLAVYGKRRKNA